MGGAHAGTIEQKKVPVEEVDAIKELFRRTPPGSGADDRFPSYPKDNEQDHAQLSRIDQSLKKNSLKMALEGSRLGSVSKLSLISQAVDEGILAESSTKVASISAGGLFKDWEM